MAAGINLLPMQPLAAVDSDHFTKCRLSPDELGVVRVAVDTARFGWLLVGERVDIVGGVCGRPLTVLYYIVLNLYYFVDDCFLDTLVNNT